MNLERVHGQSTIIGGSRIRMAGTVGLYVLLVMNKPIPNGIFKLLSPKKAVDTIRTSGVRGRICLHQKPISIFRSNPPKI